MTLQDRPARRAFRSALVIVLPIASVLVSLAAAEGLLRMGGYQYSPLNLTNEAVSKHDYRHMFFTHECFQFDPKLIWRPRPGHQVFNEQGFRGDLLEKEHLSRTIVTLGDSNTLGRFDHKAWPAHLKDRLGRERVRVVNAGVWGYTVLQGVERFKRDIASKPPHIVTISFGGNDPAFAGWPDRDYIQGKLWTESLIPNWRLTELTRSFYDWLFTPKLDPSAPRQLRVKPEEYADGLNVLIRESKWLGTTPVLLTRPTRADNTQNVERLARYNQIVRQVAGENDVLLIDAAAVFANRLEPFLDECHFTEAGHEEMGALVASALRPLLEGKGPSRSHATVLDVLRNLNNPPPVLVRSVP